MTNKTFFTVLAWFVSIAIVAVTLDWYTSRQQDINRMCANYYYGLYQEKGSLFTDCEKNGDDLQFVKVGDRYSLRCVYRDEDATIKLHL